MVPGVVNRGFPPHTRGENAVVGGGGNGHAVGRCESSHEQELAEDAKPGRVGEDRKLSLDLNINDLRFFAFLKFRLWRERYRTSDALGDGVKMRIL